MLRARVPQVLTLAVGMTACTGSPPAGPDGGSPDTDGSTGIDGAVDPSTRGLTVRFVADPALPALFDDGGLEVSIESVELRLDDLRIIGDAAPGDERTRIDSLRLHWGDRDGSDGGDGDGDPDGWGDSDGGDFDRGDVAIEYADAPPGIYSIFRASIVHFDIEGEVEGEGDGGEPIEYDFEIERGWGQPLAIEIDLGSARLEPGGIIELTTRFDARGPLAVVPWATLSPDEDGDVEIDSDDPIMDDVQAALAGAFGTPSVD